MGAADKEGGPGVVREPEYGNPFLVAIGCEVVGTFEIAVEGNGKDAVLCLERAKPFNGVIAAGVEEVEFFVELTEQKSRVMNLRKRRSPPDDDHFFE